MTSRDFAYWLQGFFEINAAGAHPGQLTESQVSIVQKHLNLVFLHEIDPSMGPKEHQNKLNAVHSAEAKWPHTEQNTPKPEGWNNTWELSSLHGWYDPKHGRPRC